MEHNISVVVSRAQYSEIEILVDDDRCYEIDENAAGGVQIWCASQGAKALLVDIMLKLRRARPELFQ